MVVGVYRELDICQSFLFCNKIKYESLIKIKYKLCFIITITSIMRRNYIICDKVLTYTTI